MMKKQLFKSLATAGVASICLSAAQATVIDVNTLADPGGPGVCSLRSAIAAANTDSQVDGCPAGNGRDQIRFDVEGTIMLDGSQPTLAILDSVVIKGAVNKNKLEGNENGLPAGITIDGTNVNPVYAPDRPAIFVYASHTTIKNLRFTNFNRLSLNNGNEGTPYPFILSFGIPFAEPISNIRVTDNVFVGNRSADSLMIGWPAIELNNVNGFVVSGNETIDSRDGLALAFGSTNGEVYRNVFDRSFFSGIALVFDANGNDIHNNVIKNSLAVNDPNNPRGYGIRSFLFFGDPVGNVIRDNTFTGNERAVALSNDGNSVIDNYFMNNGVDCNIDNVAGNTIQGNEGVTSPSDPCYSGN